jgi:hypothetical protein
VTEMANAKWQQRRLSNIESELFEYYMEKPRKASDPAYDSHNATVEHTAAFRIMSESTSLTMLNRMGARLERTYSRAFNNLLRLRGVSITKDEKRTQPQDQTPATNQKSPQVGQASWPVVRTNHPRSFRSSGRASVIFYQAVPVNSNRVNISRSPRTTGACNINGPLSFVTCGEREQPRRWHDPC